MAELVWFVVCAIAGYLFGAWLSEDLAYPLIIGIIGGAIAAAVMWFLGVAVFLDGDPW